MSQKKHYNIPKLTPILSGVCSKQDLIFGLLIESPLLSPLNRSSSLNMSFLSLFCSSSSRNDGPGRHWLRCSRSNTNTATTDGPVVHHINIHCHLLPVIMWWLSSTAVSYCNEKSNQQVQVGFLNTMSHGGDVFTSNTWLRKCISDVGSSSALTVTSSRNEKKKHVRTTNCSPGNFMCCCPWVICPNDFRPGGEPRSSRLYFISDLAGWHDISFRWPITRLEMWYVQRKIHV